MQKPVVSAHVNVPGDSVSTLKQQLRKVLVLMQMMILI